MKATSIPNHESSFLESGIDSQSKRHILTRKSVAISCVHGSKAGQPDLIEAAAHKSAMTT